MHSLYGCLSLRACYKQQAYTFLSNSAVQPVVPTFGAVGGRSSVQVVRFDTLLLLERLRESIWSVSSSTFKLQAQDPISRSQTHVTIPRCLFGGFPEPDQEKGAPKA